MIGKLFISILAGILAFIMGISYGNLKLKKEVKQQVIYSQAEYIICSLYIAMLVGTFIMFLFN
jgi:putative Mn2+ efflux pump MntP